MKTVHRNVQWDKDGLNVFDYAGREYLPLSTDCGVEDLFEQINSALVTFGVQLILGVMDDQYAFRVEKVHREEGGTKP
jgi:hypothetical protein